MDRTLENAADTGKERFFVKGALPRFALMFVPSAILTVVLTAYFYTTHVETQRDRLRANEILNVGLGYGALLAGLKSALGDLLYLSDHVSALAFEDGGTTQLGADFVLLARSKRFYDQIRYVNLSGREVVRVNYGDGTATVVPEADLQEKSHRYYFTETVRLGPGHVFVSPFDLNIEHGAVERPLKPMIRLGTPVFDAAGTKRGVVLLNVLGDRLREAFAAATANIADHVMLVDLKGNWLKSPVADDEWGFMLGRPDRTLADRFPDSWRRIMETEAGQFEDAAGLWTVRTVHPFAEGAAAPGGGGVMNAAAIHPTGYGWKVVARLPAETLGAAERTEARRALLVVALIVGGLIVASWLVARSRATLHAYQENLERTVAKRTADLRETNQQLRIAKEEAVVANQSKTRFLANMSHELRTPLNAIVGFADLISGEVMGPVGNDTYKEYAGDIGASGRHLTHMVNDLFDVARIETNALTFRPEPVNLERTAVYCMRLVQKDADTGGVETHVDIPTDLPPVTADRGRLVQIVTNLLSNAVKFTPQGGSVTMAARRDDMGDFLIEIRDTGCGIPADHLGRVFEPFSRREDPMVASKEGAGLGLSITRSLVAMHGGAIDIESTVGVGTTARIRLPGPPEGG